METLSTILDPLVQIIVPERDATKGEMLAEYCPRCKAKPGQVCGSSHTYYAGCKARWERARLRVEFKRDNLQAALDAWLAPNRSDAAEDDGHEDESERYEQLSPIGDHADGHVVLGASFAVGDRVQVQPDAYATGTSGWIDAIVVALRPQYERSGDSRNAIDSLRVRFDEKYGIDNYSWRHTWIPLHKVRPDERDEW